MTTEKFDLVNRTLNELRESGVSKPTPLDVVLKAETMYGPLTMVRASDVNGYFADDPHGQELVRTGQCDWQRKGRAPRWAENHPEWGTRLGAATSSLPVPMNPSWPRVKISDDLDTSVPRHVRTSITAIGLEVNRSADALEERGLTKLEQARRKQRYNDLMEDYHENYNRILKELATTTFPAPVQPVRIRGRFA